ncbi:hypothetical protein N7530_004199 [Penicillium desertorum]|uniref:Uncharacterized protein n=1 Tax=Penicillium desertorum TaxID=1303715 RepID=A0A9W9WY56_9EURO|nr:hypothetical protein N7530_004199 [Penicillium desertorum]
MPADVNDADITQEEISRPSSAPTQMSVMLFKVRLFRISTQICHHISGPSRLEVEPLNEFDATIAAEQQRWDSTYLVDDMPPSFESGLYREELNKLVLRMENLSRRSAICLKAHRILLQLQTQSGAENQQLPNSRTRFESTIEDWTDMREWFGADLFNWNLDNVGNIPAV